MIEKRKVRSCFRRIAVVDIPSNLHCFSVLIKVTFFQKVVYNKNDYNGCFCCVACKSSLRKKMLDKYKGGCSQPTTGLSTGSTVKELEKGPKKLKGFAAP